MKTITNILLDYHFRMTLYALWFGVVLGDILHQPKWIIIVIAGAYLIDVFLEKFLTYPRKYNVNYIQPNPTEVNLNLIQPKPSEGETHGH